MCGKAERRGVQDGKKIFICPAVQGIASAAGRAAAGPRKLEHEAALAGWLGGRDSNSMAHGSVHGWLIRAGGVVGIGALGQARVGVGVGGTPAGRGHFWSNFWSFWSFGRIRRNNMAAC